MSPVFQRLRVKPPAPSLDLLRYLRGQCLHTSSPALSTVRRPSLGIEYACSGSHKLRQIHATALVDSVANADRDSLKESQSSTKPPTPNIQPGFSAPNIAILNRVTILPHITWTEDLFTFEQLVFESDVAHATSSDAADGQRLVDHPELVDEAELWLCLLQFRERVYGSSGVHTILQGFMEREELFLERKFWHTRKFWKVFGVAFLRLGLRDTRTLPDVLKIATCVRRVSKAEWQHLYIKVIDHMAKMEHDVIKWHEMMIRDHSPTAQDLCWFLNNTQISIATQKQIYIANTHRAIYDRIISRLLARHKYKRAADWHFFLVSHGDVPSNAKVMEPMFRFFRIYDQRMVDKLNESLAAINIALPLDLKTISKVSPAADHNVENLAQDVPRNAAPKTYNDSLGARWLATRWVPLDVTMSTMHALGVTVIGPLSLQAIALRDMNVIAVYDRIKQLRELGINLDASAYTTAISTFAANRDAQNMEALLKSDIHPEAYDNQELQDSLLKAANQQCDWEKFHLLMKVRACSTNSVDPPCPVQGVYENLDLVNYAETGQVGRLTSLLHKMHERRIVVTPATIRSIIASLLPRHQPSKIPATHHEDEIRDKALPISILVTMTKSGNTIPFSTWHEIYKRLGKTGRLEELSQLCLFLAKWYKSESQLRSTGTTLTMPLIHNRAIVSRDVQNTNPMHPLRRLFPPSLQKAIIEWGFIKIARTNQRRNGSSYFAQQENDLDTHTQPYLWGVHLLRQLHNEGVAVHQLHIRRAIEDRLIVIFGPGHSYRRSNRIVKATNDESLEVMAEKINRVWGGKVLPHVTKLKKELSVQYEKRMVKTRGKVVRRAVNRAAADEETAT